MAGETKQFSDYINCHITEIVNHINEQFHNSKDFIKAKILHEIKRYLEPLPIHYEWQYDGCPYDCSGELVYDGYVSLNQTISDFLANEYSGQRVPTYESGRGFNYLTYGDKLSDFTRSLADTIMYNSVKSQLKKRIWYCNWRWIIFRDNRWLLQHKLYWVPCRRLLYLWNTYRFCRYRTDKINTVN